MSSGADTLVVAVLGPGRLGETHVAALARLRERGLQVNGRRVSVEPALFGRNSDRLRELAERYNLKRTSTDLNELIDEARSRDHCETWTDFRATELSAPAAPNPRSGGWA